MNNLTKKWCDEVRSGLLEQDASDGDLRLSMSMVETETDHQLNKSRPSSSTGTKKMSKKRKSRVRLSPKALKIPGQNSVTESDSSDAAFELIKAKS
jgi:hypothetical protein